MQFHSCNLLFFRGPAKRIKQFTDSLPVTCHSTNFLLVRTDTGFLQIRL